MNTNTQALTDWGKKDTPEMKKQGQTKQYEGSAISGTFLYLQQRDSPLLVFPGHTVY